MVLGCYQVGDIGRIEGKMDQKLHHSILVRRAIPSGRCLVGQKIVFQQDNDTKNTPNWCTKYFLKKENASFITQMDKPPQSPDVSSIEFLWDELHKKSGNICILTLRASETLFITAGVELIGKS